MHPIISENELSIEINEILDDDFQEVHPVVFELPAQLDHTPQVENMSIDVAQLMGVVLL